MWARNDNFYYGTLKQKTTEPKIGSVIFMRFSGLAVGAHLSEALAAVDGTVSLGLEGHLGLAAAAGAGCGEELTGATGSVLASVTASLAALGLVLEAALCVELLLTGGEHELLATLFAH